MIVKDFINMLINVRCSEKSIIYDAQQNGKEVYYGYINEKQVYKCLENKTINGM